MRKHALRWIVSAGVSLPVSVTGVAAMTQAAPHMTQVAPKGEQPATSTFSHIGRAPKNPFGKLFQPRASKLRQLETPQPPELRPVPSLPTGSHEPQIDCKIRVILADPSLDRGIRVPTPPVETTFAMRILEHPCLRQ
jgi:hypothetical protein